MRRLRGGSLLLGFVLVAALASDPAPAAKPPLCAGGAFQVEAAASPLVPGGAVPDLLTVGDDGTTAIASGCPEVAGRLRATKKGTKLAARWTKKTALCTGLPKKASLAARFDPGCDTLSGTFHSKGLKRPFTATRAGITLDGLVPASIHGEAQHVAHATGADLLAADPTWADTFAALGASADTVAIATSAPLPDSALDLHTLAWTAPGAGWAQRLADLAAGIAAHPGAGYAAEEQTLGGRSVWELTAPADPSVPATYYAVSGDTLLVLTSADEALAGEVLGALPPVGTAAVRAGVPRGDPPAPGTSPLALLMLGPVAQPVCVAEPYDGRVWVQLLALDGYYQAPLPALFMAVSAVLGTTNPPATSGGVGAFNYKATSFGNMEQMQFQAISFAGGQGFSFVTFPVRHCLNGTWLDADRQLQVDHDFFDQVTAHIQTGTVCGEPGGIDFSGTLSPGSDHFSGSDLKVCNVDECVQAGLKEPSTVADYDAAVSLDGNSVQFDWGSVQFDLVYDDNHKLIACNPNGDVEPRSFTIQRILFGPSVP